MELKTLSTLRYEDLIRCPVWVVTGDPDDEDVKVTPLSLASGELVPADVREAWCLCRARFADGSEHPASGMCRGDDGIGPLLWSVWNGNEDVPLVIPPAPAFVLADQGPVSFATRFRRGVSEVFPLTIEAVVRFATEPKDRVVRIGGILG